MFEEFPTVMKPEASSPSFKKPSMGSPSGPD